MPCLLSYDTGNPPEPDETLFCKDFFKVLRTSCYLFSVKCTSFSKNKLWPDGVIFDSEWHPPSPQQRLDHCMIIWKYIEGFFINIPQNIMHIWNQNDAPEVSSMFLFLIERLDRQLAPVFCMKCQKGYFQDIVLLDLELTYKL